MGTLIGVDGGNTKTDLVVLTADGEPQAYVRGPGSNSHALGADGCVRVLSRLAERAGVDAPAEHAAFFLCGADVPADIAELTATVSAEPWVRTATVENDTFALLRAGTDAPDAVAVICGAGINCVGRAGDGRVARYPSLGWETGDWGGSELVGREALFLAARAEDGRGEASVLPELIRAHFGISVAEVGEAVHYRRLRAGRLGELAPAVVEAAAGGDAVARMLIERLADEIVLLAVRALRDLRLRGADVVLGGGMLRDGCGYLFDEVVSRLRRREPGVRPLAASDPPVVGAALAALDAAGAPAAAGEVLRAAFRNGLTPDEVDAG
jgi:N-acetylglucosamine kinase-like BadF-type ATPase